MIILKFCLKKCVVKFQTQARLHFSNFKRNYFRTDSLLSEETEKYSIMPTLTQVIFRFTLYRTFWLH